MIAGLLSDPLDLIAPAFSVEQLRRLQGGLEVRLAELQDERGRATTLREKLDLAQVMAIYAEGIQRCRDAIRAKRRRAGWPEYRRPLGPSARRSRSPRPVHAQGVMPRRPSAGHAAGRLGVAGALPPPVMGHGWPALSRAGSAARSRNRSGNASDPSPEDAPPS